MPALKPAGVTVPQYAALFVLSESPGISAAALARQCGVTPPTMNTVLANLQDRGFIERALADEFTPAERETLSALLERAAVRLDSIRPE